MKPVDENINILFSRFSWIALQGDCAGAFGVVNSISFFEALWRTIEALKNQLVINNFVAPHSAMTYFEWSLSRDWSILLIRRSPSINRFFARIALLCQYKRWNWFGLPRSTCSGMFMRFCKAGRLTICGPRLQARNSSALHRILLGYYMRFIVTDEKDVSLGPLESALKQIDPAYLLTGMKRLIARAC